MYSLHDHEYKSALYLERWGAALSRGNVRCARFYLLLHCWHEWKAAQIRLQHREVLGLSRSVAMRDVYRKYDSMREAWVNFRAPVLKVRVA